MMVMLIGLGLTYRAAYAGDVDVPAHSMATAAITTTFPANAVFDSGAARGSNAADIPLAGTTDADDGAQIEARIVRADTGAEVHPWAAIATAASGAWSGSFPAATRNANRLKAEVRVQNSAASSGTMVDDFMVGHVIALIGQSEDSQMFDTRAIFDVRAEQVVPTFANDLARDSFFLVSFTEGSVSYADNGIINVNETTPHTASVAAMADVVTRSAPGEKVLFINATRAGSSYLALADNQNLDRDWDETFADGVALVRSYGGDVGVLMSTWTAAPSASGDQYRILHYPLFTGQFAPDDGARGGDTYIVGSDMGSGRNYDNLFWDLSGQNRAAAIFDAAVTRMFFYGPHRFEDYAVGVAGFLAADHATDYISIIDTAGKLSHVNPLRLYTVDAMTNTFLMVEVSATGAFAGEETTLFTGSGHVDEVLGAGGAFYRLTTVGGGKYGLATTGGANDVLLDQKQDTRVSIRNWVDDPEVATIMLPKGPEIITYMNGSPSAFVGGTKIPLDHPDALAWTDGPHPSAFDDDGLPARARHTGVAALYALGIGPAAVQNRHVPRFNRADWQTTHVDLWYEAPDGSTPPITTTRIARGEPAIPDTFPHRTEVAGFYIGTQPAQRVEIVAGRVRVYPDGAVAAGEFDYTHTIRYGLGGASGNIRFPEDPLDEWWKNLPIADMGLSGRKMDGVALEPLPDVESLANTLPAPATFTTIRGSGPSFSDPAGVGAGQDAVTFEALFTFKGGTAQNDIFTISGGQFLVNMFSGGNLRGYVLDSSGTNVMSSGANTGFGAQIPPDTTARLVVTFSLTARKFHVFLNGVQVFEDDLQPNTGALNSGRSLNFGGNNRLGAEVEFFRVWKTYAPDGDTATLGVPYKEVLGDGTGNARQIPATSIWN